MTPALSIHAVLFVTIAFLAGQMPATPSTCALGPNLYASRLHLVSRYAHEVGNNYLANRSVADALLGKRRSVDQQYFQYMLAVSNATASKNDTLLRSCCNPESTDLIARQICALGAYLLDRKEHKALFLSAIPSDTESAAALWALDEISHSVSADATPSLTGIDLASPVDQYLKEVFQIAAEGNESALQKYLGLYSLADGEYSEFMDDQLVTLFLNYPSIVLANWRFIRSHKRLMTFIRETIPAEKKRTAADRYCSVCAEMSSDCKELLGLLR